MIKTVQVEEKRCVCDICNNKYFVMHGITDTKREGWLNIKNFAATGKDLDICQSCTESLRSYLYGDDNKDGEC